MSKYYKTQNATILYLNSSFNCVKSSSVSFTRTSGGTGYTSAPTATIITASGDSGTGASISCSYSAGSVDTITINSYGSNYTKLPTIKLSGGGDPGSITNYTALVGGSGYALPPLVSLSGGDGSNFSGYTTLTATTVSTTVNIINGGTDYITGDIITFDNTDTGGGSGVAGTVIASAGVITGITLTNAGSGYTLKAPKISSIKSIAGKGAIINLTLTPTSVGSIVITNGGSNYTIAPTFVFTPVSGGTGASATPTINLGTSAVITPSFYRTYSYTWNIPQINIDDLARLSAINIISTNFTTTTPYTYRIQNIQYQSRDTYFSDYGAPILSMAQNVNVCSYGSLGGNPFCIILTSQTLNQITITVDDDITKIGSGQTATINFVIALEIEEYDPTITEIGNPFAEAINRIRPQF